MMRTEGAYYCEKEKVNCVDEPISCTWSEFIYDNLKHLRKEKTFST